METNKCVSKIARHRSIYKNKYVLSHVFLYICCEQSKNGIKKIIPFTIVYKSINYLRLNFTKEK